MDADVGVVLLGCVGGAHLTCMADAAEHEDRIGRRKSAQRATLAGITQV